MKLPASALLMALLLTSPLDTTANDAIVEIARIGVLEGASEYMFGHVAFLCVLRNGRVITSDLQLEQIRIYDSSGAYVGDIGRAGQGPGEYHTLQGMRVLPDGQLVVLSEPGRLTFFDIDSQSYVSDFGISSYLHAPRMLEYDNNGYVYVKTVEGTPQPSEELSFAWLKVKREGEVVDQILIPQEDPTPKAFTLMFPEGARQNFVTATKSTWSSAGCLISGRNDRYSFVIHSPEGAINVARDLPRIRLGDQERREWQAWADFLGGEYEIPDVKPAYRELYTDSDSRIWVHRYVEAVGFKMPPRESGDKRPVLSWREPTVFDVFTGDGKFLRTVELPGLTGTTAFAGDHIWGVQPTAGGERLVHWQVPGLGAR